jgi:hypothetical protein
MPLKKGTEKTWQIYLVAALCLVAVCVIGWEIKDNFGGPSVPVARPAAALPVAQPAKAPAMSAGTPAAAGGQEAQKLSNAGIDPALHLEKLALTEDVEYLGTGRNIFSAESVPPPARIEDLASGPRPGQPGQPGQPGVTVASTAPVKPTPPAINLTYFGYTQDKDKSLQAFFVHGDDIFIARTGEIVDHRYKVGNILPGSVQVTDLGYNNMQSLVLKTN